MSNQPEKRVPVTRQMLLGAVAGALLIVSAGCLMADWTGGTWSDAAGWTEAFATVAAFGAAILAAVLVGRTLELELQREDQRLQSDQSGQAALVAVWPKTHVGEGEYDSDPIDGEFWRTTAIQGARLKLRNASPVPVTSVRVDVETTLIGDDGSVVGTIESAYRASFLAPQADPVEVEAWGDWEKAIKVPRGMTVRGDGELHESVSVQLDFYFTDAAGVRWHRTATAADSGLAAVPPDQVALTY